MCIRTDKDALGHNLFTYCDNSPIIRNDTNGCFWEILKAVGKEFVKAAKIVAAVATAVICIAGAFTGTFMSGGAGAVAIPMAMTIAIECLGAAAVIAGAGATAVAAGAIGENIKYAKSSRKSNKERSTQHPSWVNSNDIDPNLSAQQNAENLLNEKYGVGNWNKGPNTEYNQIVKWINRNLRG